jgi:flagellum-specific ATP synthase
LTPEEVQIATAARAMMARFEDTRDLRLIGGYQPGTDPELDRAVARVPRLYEVICQGPFHRSSTNIFAEVDKILHGS